MLNDRRIWYVVAAAVVIVIFSFSWSGGNKQPGQTSTQTEQPAQQ